MIRFNLIAVAALAVGVGIILAGCGKKAKEGEAQPPATAEEAAKAPTSPAAMPVNPRAPVSEQEKQRIAQAVAMREGKAPPPPTIQLRGGELATPEVLQAYNQMLSQLIFQRHEPPESLDELVRKWPLPRLPTPPPGKRIVYDGRYHIIRLDPP